MLLFVSISSIQAQIPAGTFTVNGKTFVGFIHPNLDFDGTVAMPNDLIIQVLGGRINTRIGRIPTPTTRECSNSILYYSLKSDKPSFVQFYNIVRSVFPPARLAAIVSNDGTGISSITFNIYPNGVIEDMDFSVHRNTIITPQEIDLLYSRLKTQLVFNTIPEGCPNVAIFYEEHSLDDIETIYTDPYYFGLGKEWKNK